MESSETTITTTASFSLLSSSPTSTPPGLPATSASPAPPAVVSPCAACRILRRRCVAGCVLAPYFPPSDPLKFTTAHRVFGASNIIKLLQDLPESRRADAVSSMVYEASARVRDPVYGCAGAIWQLQRQASELQAQLAKAQAELAAAQAQNADLIAVVCAHQIVLPSCHPLDQEILQFPAAAFPQNGDDAFYLVDDAWQGSLSAEPLWA